jgi:hypothetical protein
MLTVTKMHTDTAYCVERYNIICKAKGSDKISNSRIFGKERNTVSKANLKLLFLLEN